MKHYKVFVTGGAGFIGSHLVDGLMEEGHEVTVFDNLCSGSLNNLGRWIDNSRFSFIPGDLTEFQTIAKDFKNVELVYHFSANPEVNIKLASPNTHFNDNLLATFNLLEVMKTVKTIKALIFASSSTVYGEASEIPTKEDYSPLLPISTYGASKLGCEALISSYAYTFGFKALLLRFANIIGSRPTHGVIIDFINKLKTSPHRLEILGDGFQKKSYLQVQDCVKAILQSTDFLLKGKKRVRIYNLGSSDSVTVKKIAKILIEELELKNVKLLFIGGVDGGRGWVGDVPKMQLSIEKISEVGWRPQYSSEGTIRRTIRDLKWHYTP